MSASRVGVAVLMVGALFFALHRKHHDSTPRQIPDAGAIKQQGRGNNAESCPAAVPAERAPVAPVVERAPDAGAITQQGWGNNAESFPAAGLAERALVAPLVEGAPLAGGRIARISRVQRGFEHVLVRKRGRVHDLAIGLVHAGAPGLRVGRYVVYVYGSLIPDPAAYPLADALAAAIREHPDVAPPPGMNEGFFSPTAPSESRPVEDPPPPPRPPPDVAQGVATRVELTSCPPEMVLIPGGTFLMGDAAVNATPRHFVTLRAFCMDRTEVTVTQYQACPPSQCSLPREYRSERGNWLFFCNWGRPGAGDHPVNCVDSNQARAFCQSRGGDLPTEDQWEYAARGAASRTYPWGGEAPTPERANFCGSECVAHAAANGFGAWTPVPNWTDRWPATAPVSELPAAGNTPEGLVGMAGNVGEWTRTFYGQYTARSGNATRYRAVVGTLRIFRGGAGDYLNLSGVRAGNRDWVSPEARDNLVGFRCVREEP